MKEVLNNFLTVSTWPMLHASLPDPLPQYREGYSLRLIAKHLRSRGMPWTESLESSGVLLEHPCVTKLYQAVVETSNMEEAEEALGVAASHNFFDSYKLSEGPLTKWRPLEPNHHEDMVPRSRSGHAMALDAEHGRIFLFGGWTGKENLEDLWVYTIATQTWTLLSSDVQNGGGPAARNCHAMVYDQVTQSLFLLGAYMDHQTALSTSGPSSEIKSDFWRYTLSADGTGRWSKLSTDTHVSSHFCANSKESQLPFVDRRWTTLAFRSCNGR